MTTYIIVICDNDITTSFELNKKLILRLNRAIQLFNNHINNNPVILLIESDVDTGYRDYNKIITGKTELNIITEHKRLSENIPTGMLGLLIMEDYIRKRVDNVNIVRICEGHSLCTNLIASLLYIINNKFIEKIIIVGNDYQQRRLNFYQNVLHTSLRYKIFISIVNTLKLYNDKQKTIVRRYEAFVLKLEKNKIKLPSS